MGVGGLVGGHHIVHQGVETENTIWVVAINQVFIFCCTKHYILLNLIRHFIILLHDDKTKTVKSHPSSALNQSYILLYSVHSL